MLYNTMETLDRVKILQSQPCFSKFAQSELHELSLMLRDKNFQPGETIVKEGDLVDSVYIIVSGTADVQKCFLQNNIMNFKSVAILKAGEAIGLSETGFYSLSGRRTATVIAISEIILLRLNVAAFHGFALAYPHISEIMRAQSSQLLGGRKT